MKAAASLQHETPKAVVTAIASKATFNPLQLKTEVKEETLQMKQNPLRAINYKQNPLQLLREETSQPNINNSLQLKENRTGLPDDLKTGVEALSGYNMDDVRVHYNSDKPRKLQALAFTHEIDIHVAPGQEKYLPHEAWHVVQQKQGRVQPTMQMKGVRVNSNKELEQEANVMGEKAIQLYSQNTSPVQFFKGTDLVSSRASHGIVQLQPRVFETRVNRDKGAILHKYRGRDERLANGEKLFVDYDSRVLSTKIYKPYRYVYNGLSGDRIGYINSDYLDLKNPYKGIKRPPAVHTLDTSKEDISEDALRIDQKIVDDLKLNEFDEDDVTIFEKAETAMKGIRRVEKKNVLYKLPGAGALYHGTTLEAGLAIEKSGLDPNYGGRNGAKGLITEPLNAPGYIYISSTAEGAQAAIENFYQQHEDEYEHKNIRFCVLEVEIPEDTILVQDPDLAQAIRTTRKCNAKIIKEYVKDEKSKRGGKKLKEVPFSRV